MNNVMKMKFTAIPENVAFARNAVAAFCVGLDPTIDEINDIKTSVSEAVTNCIVHAYGADTSKNEITVEVTVSDRDVHIVISDTGIGITDIQMAMQPFFTTKPDQERSGMGFTVMESFMDAVNVTHNLPSGTVVTMTKAIRGADWNKKKRSN